MIAARWQLEEQKASLVDAAAHASIDLAHPERGLSLVLPDKSNAGLQLSVLGFALGDAHEAGSPEVDAYARQNDLVATFERSEPRPMRAQVYWRWLEPSEFAPEFASYVLVALDLIASVNTSLLDADPASAVRSSLAPVSEVANLTQSEQGGQRARHVGPAPRGHEDLVTAIGPTEANTGCFTARLAIGGVSWVEMVHPTDFRGSRVTFSNGPLPGHCSADLEHKLFEQRLEKGVILRARIRGALVRQANDADCAIAAFRRFSAAEPPLTV
jgi:hypothetical protein